VFDDAGALWVRQGADTFTAVTNVPWSVAGTPTRVWFHPTRRGLGFASGGSGLWRTIDGGATWRAVPGILGVVRDMIFDPTVRNLTVVLTDRGIWSSSDLGRSWRDDESDPTGARTFPVSGTIGPNGRMVLTTAAGGTVGLERVANREFVFSNVFFAPGSAVPDPGLEPHLDDLARRMLSDRTTVLRVDGHTDSDGSTTSNLDLSQRRAQWVVDFIASRGVPLSRLQAVGYGESRPLFSNDAPGGQARNRRVELVLLGPSGSLPKLDGMQ
jgi:outer membrane protein OmpA-like peptidoglycan-associated protein